VRDDSGTYEGAEVSSFYDPLVSKLCVWAPDRPRAIAKMKRALSEYVIAGIRTNLPFHLRLMDHPEYVAGDYDTGFIDRHRDALCMPSSDERDADVDDAMAIAAALVHAIRDDSAQRRASIPPPPPMHGHAGNGTLSPWRAAALPRR
jgi:acetyl-CoA carboxylase biotin carboxylase subunit